MTAALFLVEAAAFFADHEVRIERVLTDNAKAYTESVVFAETAAALGDPAQADPSLPAPDQRQGRAVQQDAAG